MRIAQITPGIMPIPPNGWGAVEKIIWEYTRVLTSLGHETKILYADDIKPGEWDIVHVHMANLALILKERGIPYVFSHHDHHAYHFGKNSEAYKKNIEAIKGSILSFVHAKYLVDFFENQPQIRYLGHGANIYDYIFMDRSSDLLQNGAKVIMMAHNGIIGDYKFDRKGFIPGILAAKKLDLPITIICPSKINKDFLESNPEISTYKNLTVMYDLDYQTSLSVMNSHHIFLNPGVLEAGHPNLTVAESISMGIPVVGTMESHLPGLKRVPIVDGKVTVNHLSEAIEEVLNTYSSHVLDCQKQRDLLSWEVIVSRMLMDYTDFVGINQNRLLLDSYNNTQISHKKIDGGFYYWFKRHPYFYKSSTPESDSLSIIFKDAKTGSVINYFCPGENKRSWIRTTDDQKKFIDWEIVLMDGSEFITSFKMDLRGQHVLIEGGEKDCASDVIDQFIRITGCIPTLEEGINCHVPHFRKIGSEDNFYRILNTDQIQDFFVVKTKIPNNPLLLLQTGSLGDTISFLPYAEEFAKRSGLVCDVVCSFDFLFKSLYPNVNIIKHPSDLRSYTNIISCVYKFHLPLQEGFARQLKILDLPHLRPIVVKSNKKRPLNKKYVCFSMHSTAQAKFWNNKDGWSKLGNMLKKRGLTLVCIDRYFSFGIDGHWNEIPSNCLNKSGMELLDMLNWIEHCEFFIGLSSGLSWLAHALGKKVVMISGVTLPNNEFHEDCIRIHRDDVCNSCFNFPEKYPFDKGDWLWCPVHNGTSRAFECTKKISAEQVMNKIISSGWIL
jgi:autotransporter strand-loop-strand O-heptosyltransferase